MSGAHADDVESTDPRIASLRRDLRNAQALADRDASDLGHMNPGRLRRNAKERLEQDVRAVRLAAAISIAEDLEAQDIAWTRVGDWIHFLLADGTTISVAGEASPAADRDERIGRQIETLREAATTHDVRRDLMLLDLDVEASRDLKWVRERLHGVSAPKFRKTFLVEAGLLRTDGDDVGLAAIAADHGLLFEHEGQFGTWFTASPLGVAWMYRAYLAGRVPMAKSTAPTAPESQCELEAIAEAQADALADLPGDLQAWCLPKQVG